MTTSLPEYYFRIRENGALVFRLDTENRNRRIEMDQIAIVHLRRNEIKPHGNRTLSEADLKAIKDWMAERSALMSARETDDLLRTVDQLNLTTQWVQTRASDDQIDAVSDALLLAMHDLRQVLVRKKSERATSSND